MRVWVNCACARIFCCLGGQYQGANSNSFTRKRSFGVPAAEIQKFLGGYFIWELLH